VEDVIETAIGGMTITTTVEGRERYPVSVRYPRELRDDPERLARVLVATPDGAQVPIGQLADIRRAEGPPMIRDENGALAGYVFVDVAGRDLGGYVEDAKRVVARAVKLPLGYALPGAGSTIPDPRAGSGSSSSCPPCSSRSSSCST
jgi:Cu(I)/Ag(I) efflux system membrane protein CusA/SilA